jgi:hypothetical protein
MKHDLHHVMADIMRAVPTLNTRQLLDIAQAIQPMDPELDALTVKELLALLGRSTANTV